MKLGAVPGRTLTLAVGIYALVIAGLALLAAGAASSLTSAKLQGIVHALQSIASERNELTRLREAGRVSEYFMSAEAAKAAQLAKDLRDSAATIDVPEKDKATRESATALASKIIAEAEGRSP
jgi:hypothetical protein